MFCNINLPLSNNFLKIRHVLGGNEIIWKFWRNIHQCQQLCLVTMCWPPANTNYWDISLLWSVFNTSFYIPTHPAKILISSLLSNNMFSVQIKRLLNMKYTCFFSQTQQKIFKFLFSAKLNHQNWWTLNVKEWVKLHFMGPSLTFTVSKPSKLLHG